MWKTASASPPSGGRPRLVADHTHKEPCTKTAGRGLAPFYPSPSSEVSVLPFLKRNTRWPGPRAHAMAHASSTWSVKCFVYFSPPVYSAYCKTMTRGLERNQKKQASGPTRTLVTSASVVVVL